MPHFIITVRPIDGPDFAGGLGAIRCLDVPDDVTHAATLRIWLAAVMATFPRPPGADGRPSPVVGDALFIVHGFNQTVAAVAALHDSIGAGLAAQGYAPTLISFDWPSESQVCCVPPDLELRQRPSSTLDAAVVPPNAHYAVGATSNIFL